METVTVQGYIGPKQVNREQFVEAWTDQLTGLWSLCYSQEDRERADRIRADLEALAGGAFDKLLAEEKGAE